VQKSMAGRQKMHLFSRENAQTEKDKRSKIASKTVNEQVNETSAGESNGDEQR